MRYMCAERNKLRRVFSTAIDLVKALIRSLSARYLCVKYPFAVYPLSARYPCVKLIFAVYPLSARYPYVKYLFAL